jgi:hypothetical protein
LAVADSFAKFLGQALPASRYKGPNRFYRF